MKGTGAEALVATLQQLAVERVFGIPGIQTLELFDALADATFPTILTTDERSAAFMADAHARVTGRLGVLAVTPGPGLTNALTGLAEARFDSSAVLAIVASHNPALRRQFQLHAMDQAAVLKPLVKAGYAVRSVGEIPAVLLQAAQTAMEGEPGPVAVEFPYNVFIERGEFAMPAETPRRAAPPDAAMLDRMAGELARSPLVGIYVGRGARQGVEALRRLAEVLQAPVATTISGRGILSEDHPLSVGFGFGPCGQSIAEKIFSRVDNLLAIGCK